VFADVPLCAAPAAPTPVQSRRDASGQPIQITASGAVVDPVGDAALTGPVEIHQGDRTLTARDAHYNTDQESFDARGNVDYTDPSLTVSGEAAQWSGANGGRFEHARFTLPARSAHGSADAIDLAANGRLTLRNVAYTACPAGYHDWLLNARQIDIDQQTQVGIGHDVRLEFMGVPLMYLPWVSFPVGEARKSGFLFPNFGQSTRNGVELSIPYYFNLAPNYDATVTPGVLMKRGVTLGGEFRYLTEQSHGEFKADWLPSDASAHRDRSYLRFTDSTDFGGLWRFDTNVAAASDSNYFQDFGLGSEGTSVEYLKRVARVSYLDDHWRAAAVVEQFQTIDQTILDADRPYARAPQLLVDGHWSLGGNFGAEVSGETVEFLRNTGAKGLRYGLDPTLTYSWRQPGLYLLPSVGVRSIGYALSDAPSGSASPHVIAPMGTVDAGMTFERYAGDRVQTLEPRILYTYVPYRDQSAQPLFDTGLPDFNLIQLFSSQRYVGGDRIADANQLAVGATTRLIDSASGRQWISATLGQIYYFTPPRVRLANETAPSAGASDLIGQINVAALGHFNVQLGEQWNPHSGESARTEVRLQYQPEPDKVANLGYRYRQGLLEQVDSSLAWPISSRWRLYGREVYSLQDHAGIESLGGFEYKSCCFRIRIIARHFVASRTGNRDTSISLQLELNGLSTVGERADAFLERSIRGYSAAQAYAGP
jgi:LPS-assembly protein